MMTSEHVRAALSDINPDAVFFDNLDSALIGIGNVAHLEPVPVYSKKRIFDKLFADGFSKEESVEYFLNKVVTVFVEHNTPIIFDDMYDRNEE
jgi:hypothetical protein